VHCNTLQHAATRCDTLRHAATAPSLDGIGVLGSFDLIQFVHCNTLQHTATRCNTLQHAATAPSLDGIGVLGSFDLIQFVHLLLEAPKLQQMQLYLSDYGQAVLAFEMHVD